MKDINDTLTYKGKEYLLTFNLNVITDIQEKYGTLENWIEIAYGRKTGEPSTKALSFCVAAMINEGISIANEEGKEYTDPITEKQAGRMLSEMLKDNGGLEGVVGKIDELMQKSLQGGEDSKNE